MDELRTLFITKNKSNSGSPGCEETTDGCFIPNIATAIVGDKIIMKNTDVSAHTFTSGNPSDGPDGLFDSGLLMPDESHVWIPQKEGTFAYLCLIHPWMVGEIVVGEDTEIKERNLKLTGDIPDLVKIIFGWYANDQVSEDELLDAIRYLIKEGILKVE